MAPSYSCVGQGGAIPTEGSLDLLLALLPPRLGGCRSRIAEHALRPALAAATASKPIYPGPLAVCRHRFRGVPDRCGAQVSLLIHSAFSSLARSAHAFRLPPWPLAPLSKRLRDGFHSRRAGLPAASGCCLTMRSEVLGRQLCATRHASRPPTETSGLWSCRPRARCGRA